MSARASVKNSQWLPVVALLALPLQATERYPLDSSNTQVCFAIEHLGIQWMTARFSDISGVFIVDPKGITSRVEVTVGIASLESSEPRWNERLRSAEWLDVQRYPRMTYHSLRIELSDHRGTASGELTLHGITHPMALEVDLQKCPASGSCQFTAHGRIRRSDYGLPHGFWTGGDQVEINISGTLTDGGRAVANQMVRQ